jgi:hypothetical protein
VLTSGTLCEGNKHAYSQTVCVKCGYLEEGKTHAVDTVESKEKGRKMKVQRALKQPPHITTEINFWHSQHQHKSPISGGGGLEEKRLGWHMGERDRKNTHWIPFVKSNYCVSFL